jgi:hypothetical protein
MSTENDRLIRYGCSLANPQGLERWREDAERREREFKQARRREQCKQQEINSVREVALLRAEVENLRNELTQARGEINYWHDVAIEACGQALGEIRRHVFDQMQDTHNELFSLIERRHAEVMGRIDATAPDRLRANKTGFRFANERNEDCDTVVHLPNPLRRNVAN